jgi:hypothetical protein
MYNEREIRKEHLIFYLKQIEVKERNTAPATNTAALRNFFIIKKPREPRIF